MLTRLAHWWLNRRTPTPLEVEFTDEHDDAGEDWPEPVGECICGRQVTGPDRHLVVAHGTDDDQLGIDGGGTAMSADFCPDHCPGGCHHGCAKIEA